MLFYPHFLLYHHTGDINEVEIAWKEEFSKWSNEYIVDWKVQFDKYTAEANSNDPELQ